MKRDLDLVRDILLIAEGADGSIDDGVFSDVCSDVRKLAFHIELMASRGLIVANVKWDGLTGIPISTEVDSVTWEGYDYLDAIRSPRVWKRAKEVIRNTLGDASLAVVKETCAIVASKLIREQLG